MQIGEKRNNGPGSKQSLGPKKGGQMKIVEVIESLSYEELQELSQKVKNGEFRKILHSKISERENEHQKVCTNCLADLGGKDYAYTLIMGQPDFRMKASFCALDCLQYFLSKKQQRPEK